VVYAVRMRMRLPKQDKKYVWTNHVLQKMVFYRLSESRVRRVIKNPKRVEEGIAPDTIASMQPSGSKKRKEEIWVMWREKIKNEKLKSKNDNLKLKMNEPKIIIISAWRYPGQSPVGKRIQIPENVLEDLKNYI